MKIMTISGIVVTIEPAENGLSGIRTYVFATTSIINPTYLVFKETGYPVTIQKTRGIDKKYLIYKTKSEKNMRKYIETFNGKLLEQYNEKK